ncbi:ATP-binding cassette domain-containing protein, partial [Haemophilus influenzae]|nr:ATP-binding cassette domain-containing protein [Haemophilus influenzae]
MEVEKLAKRFETQLFKNLNFILEAGQRLAIIGPNGAGKSTLFSFMARLRPLESGSIAYRGKNLAGTPTAELARTLSILTQENSIMSRITVRDLLMFGRYPYHQGRPTAECRRIVNGAIEE